MSQAKYYSLRIRRDLVSKLYLQARSLNIPMKQLSDRIVADSLGQHRAKYLGNDQVGAHQEELTFEFED